jgi:hypothetical protein
MIKCIIAVGKYRIDVPNDIEIRISHEPRLTSIQTIPHSVKGDFFAYNASESERTDFLQQALIFMQSRLLKVEV